MLEEKSPPSPKKFAVVLGKVTVDPKKVVDGIWKNAVDSEKVTVGIGGFHRARKTIMDLIKFATGTEKIADGLVKLTAQWVCEKSSTVRPKKVTVALGKWKRSWKFCSGSQISRRWTYLTQLKTDSFYYQLEGQVIRNRVPKIRNCRKLSLHKMKYKPNNRLTKAGAR